MSTDVIPAMLDLERILASWVSDATATNRAVQELVAGSGTIDAVRSAANSQVTNYFGEDSPDYGDLSLYENWRQRNLRRKNNLTQFLRIYVPEFSSQFEEAVRDRYLALHELQFGRDDAGTHLLRLESKAKEIGSALQRSLHDLSKALGLVQDFIRAEAP